MPEPTSLLGFVGDLQSFLAPDPLDALAVDFESLLSGDRVGTLVAEAGSFLGEGDQPTAQFDLLVGDFGLSPLRGAILTEVAAGPTLGDVQVLDQVIDRLAPPGRA